MQIKWMRTLVGLSLTLALLLLSVRPSLAQVQAQGSVTPAAGVAGTTFTFVATGFKGSSSTVTNPTERQKDAEHGEVVTYWVNLPDGSVISSAPTDGAAQGKSGDKNKTSAFTARADRTGQVELAWMAPASAMPGSYSLVIYGLDSQYQVVIPFSVAPGSALALVPGSVAPATGIGGTTFTFVATGFNGSSHSVKHPTERQKDAERGEDVTYWINMPDGTVLNSTPTDGAAQGKAGDKDKTSAFTARADRTGRVQLSWVAPAGAQPGSYSLVIHGLDSQYEAVIPFTIQ